jgi:hypothetical protein
VAPQDPDPSEYPPEPDSNPPDLLDVLTAEHRTVERLFADFETTADRIRRRAMLIAMLAELQRHGATEERYLYPATRQYLPAGVDLAGHELRELAEADALAERVRRLDVADPQFEPLVDELMAGIRHHVQEQETELFPRLRAACVPETLRQLGAAATEM